MNGRGQVVEGPAMRDDVGGFADYLTGVTGHNGASEQLTAVMVDPDKPIGFLIEYGPIDVG